MYLYVILSYRLFSKDINQKLFLLLLLNIVSLVILKIGQVKFFEFSSYYSAIYRIIDKILNGRTCGTIEQLDLF